MPFVQIQFRRGANTEWTSANPTLAAGELGLETNTSQFKIGNGSTQWNSLGYGGLTGAQGAAGANGFAVGSSQGTSEFSNSQIGFMLVYNRVLTVEEIQQNFNLFCGRYSL